MERKIRHHRKHHKIGGWLPRMRDCRRCIEMKQECRQKVTYNTRKHADARALKHNISVRWWPDEVQVPYSCVGCLKWHLTTVKYAHQVRHCDKMYAKYMRRIHQRVDNGDISTYENRLIRWYVQEREEDETEWLWAG